MRGLLGTSAFVAGEEGRPLVADRLPEEAAVSVVTLAERELELAVQLADGEEVRARRLQRLVRATYAARPVDDNVASTVAEQVALARRRGRRPKVQDTWIAATARAHKVPVYTQDADFDLLSGVEVVRV